MPSKKELIVVDFNAATPAQKPEEPKPDEPKEEPKPEEPKPKALPKSRAKSKAKPAPQKEEVKEEVVKEEVKEEIKEEEVKEEVNEEVKEEEPKPKLTKPRARDKEKELQECPKCGKVMQMKTLKYNHEHKCKGNKPKDEPKPEEPKPEEPKPEEPKPEEPKTKEKENTTNNTVESVNPLNTSTYRNVRLARAKQRSEKISKLVANAFQN
jgi:uncharacterized C2H2 Zn-finger protein